MRHHTRSVAPRCDYTSFVLCTHGWVAPAPSWCSSSWNRAGQSCFHPVPKRGHGGTNHRSRENASHSVLNRRTRHVWPVAFWLPPAWQGGISKGGVDSCKLVGMERGSRQASAGMAGAAAVTLDTPAFQQLPAPGQLRLLADGVRRGVNVTQVGWRLAHYCSPVCWR